LGTQKETKAKKRVLAEVRAREIEIER